MGWSSAMGEAGYDHDQETEKCGGSMLDEEVRQRIVNQQQQGLSRQLRAVSQRDKHHVIVAGRRYLNFASNDYLCLTTSREVKQAFIAGVEQYGCGSGASAQVAGYFSPQQTLEQALADFVGCDRALYFSSGYLANLGTIATLASRSSHLIADRLCHASIIDGVVLSRGKLRRHRHHDVSDLATKLAGCEGHKVVITESVESMSGDIAPLAAMAPIVADHYADWIVDEAHGIGVLGSEGRGGCHRFGLLAKQVTARVIPLGKALGSMGAVVAGREEVIELLVQFARTHRYTTALPPAVAVATLKALTLLQQQSWRREQLQARIAYFRQCATARGLPLMTQADTPIQSVLITDNNNVLQLQQAMQQAGFYLFAARPPTVPAGTARLRISLNCNHREKDINQLIACLGALLCHT